MWTWSNYLKGKRFVGIQVVGRKASLVSDMIQSFRAGRQSTICWWAKVPYLGSKYPLCVISRTSNPCWSSNISWSPKVVIQKLLLVPPSKLYSTNISFINIECGSIGIFSTALKSNWSATKIELLMFEQLCACKLLLIWGHRFAMIYHFWSDLWHGKIRRRLEQLRTRVCPFAPNSPIRRFS